MVNKNVYALLVAIDKYQYPVPPLNGCVNDSKEVEAYLKSNIPEGKLFLKTLRNEDATRRNVIDAFLNHLSQAGENDTVFMHYSGHGSQEPAPPEFWHLDHDHMHESMVCYDSRRTINGVYYRDLVDKEFAALIHQVSTKNPHIILMMDCCHSGSGTREHEEEVTSRFTGRGTKGARKLNDYIFFEKDFQGDFAQIKSGQKRYAIQNGRHVLIAGCRNSETAKELIVNGKQRGIFTYSVLHTLNQTNGNITYRDLIRRVGAMVKNKVTKQNPQLDYIQSEDIHLNFLNGASTSTPKYYTINYERKRGGWIVNAGGTNGIPKPQGAETTVFAVWPAGQNIDTSDLSNANTAKITKVLPDYSKVEFDGFIPDRNTFYRAIIKESPLPKSKVRLVAEDSSDHELIGAIGLVRQAIESAGPGGVHSLHVEEAGINDGADFRIVAYKHKGKKRFRITKPSDDLPLVKQVTGFSAGTARAVVKELEHICRWTSTQGLNNPHTKLASSEMTLIMQDYDGMEIETKGEVLLQAKWDEDYEDWIYPAFRIKIKNTGKRKYYCALLFLSNDYSITNQLMAGAWIDKGQTYEPYLDGGEYGPQYDLELRVPDKLVNRGVSEVEYAFKLIISTEEFDSETFAQEGLELADSNRDDSTINTPSERGLTFSRYASGRGLPDWTTDTVICRSIRPLGRLDTEGLLENAGVKVLLPKNNKQMRFALGSVTQASRSIGSDTTGSGLGVSKPTVLPESLMNDSEPYAFVPPLTGAPELSVLEICDINDSRAVTNENPIVIDIPTSLNEGESILPIASDGELFYILGGSSDNEEGGTRITIESLPEAQASEDTATRGLGSTIKILFQKVVNKTFKLKNFPYPYLAAVTRDDTGELSYEAETLEVAKKVNTANNIVCLVHGFMGQSKESLSPKGVAAEDSLYNLLASQYDLVLAFDYESFNTELKDSAAKLKKKLESIGLKGSHNKNLHIVATSTGGLVARWMIEQLDGGEMVDHLIMIGTPNGGTPWIKIKDWAMVGATLVLNKLSVLSWPTAVLGLVTSKVKWLSTIGKTFGLNTSNVDVSDKVSDSLRTGSEFLMELQSASDPGVGYSIIAGNTSVMPKKDDADKTRLEKILTRAGIDGVQHKLLTQFLFQEANDMVSTVASMSKVDANRSPQPILYQVPVDHMSYYNTETGIAGIKKVLEKLNNQA